MKTEQKGMAKEQRRGSRCVHILQEMLLECVYPAPHIVLGAGDARPSLVKSQEHDWVWRRVNNKHMRSLYKRID